MVEHVVGARFEVKTNELVAAAKASEEQLAKLKATAAEADKAVSNLVEGQKSAGKAAGEQAKEIERVEAQLARYLTRIDPASRAVKTQVEGQALLTRALELGIITQAQYETGLVKVTEAANRQRLTTQNLLKGKLSFNDTLKLGTSLLAGFAGGLLGSLASMALTQAATALLNLAYENLWKKVDDVTKAHELFAKVLNSESILSPKIEQASRDRAAAYRAETRSLESLTEQRLADLKAQLAALQNRPLAFRVGPLGMILEPAFQLQIDRYKDAIKEGEEALSIARGRRYDEDIFSRGRIGRGQSEPRSPFGPGGPGNAPPKRTGAQSRARASDAERDLLRQADAAIKAARALDEYAEASQDIIDKAAAEFAGRRELIAQIELEAQLRKKHGVDYVERNKERIQALAQERAAAQRVADQYKATAQFLESSAGRLGDVLDASLTLPLDHSAEAVKRWEDTFVNSLRQVGAELQRLAIINPFINAIAGNDKLPTAYGEGGILSSIGKWLGGLLGSSTAGSAYGQSADIGGMAYHEGGFVGRATGQMKYLPPTAWAGAPRAHQGLQLGARERPIVALEGEGIFTPRAMNNADSIVRALAQMAAQGNAGPVVNIIDQRGANAEAVETRTRRGASGRIEVDVIVREAGKKAIGDGSWDSALRQRYGFAPKVA